MIAANISNLPLAFCIYLDTHAVFSLIYIHQNSAW